MSFSASENDKERINIFIIDDEERACLNLNNMLIEYTGSVLNVAGIFKSTADAELQLSELKPDAIFLDIEMPHENAFQFLDRISPFEFEIVFVTAYDEYAVNAFRLNAIDYILKPLSINELQRAVSKLREKVSYRKFAAEKSKAYTSIAEKVINKMQNDKLLLRDTNNIEIVSYNDVLFIEANGSYSKVVYFNGDIAKEMVVCTSLADFEELLPVEVFFRIHRSYVINVQHIRKVKADPGEVLLPHDHKLPISRRKYPVLMSILKNGLSG